MNEETGSIGAVGAVSTLDGYVSAQDASSSAQSSASPSDFAAVTDVPQRPSAQAVQNAVAQINSHLSSVDRVLSLKVDASSGYTVAQITNSQTGEVLQQFPTEDALQLEKMLARWSHGGNVLMDIKA